MTQLKRIAALLLALVIALPVLSSCAGSVTENRLSEVDWSRAPIAWLAVREDTLYYIDYSLWMTVCLMKAGDGMPKVIDSNLYAFHRANKVSFSFDKKMQIVGDILYVGGDADSPNIMSIAAYDLDTDKFLRYIDLDADIGIAHNAEWQIYENCIVYSIRYEDVEYVENHDHLYVKALDGDAGYRKIAECVETFKVIGNALYYMQFRDGVYTVSKAEYLPEEGTFGDGVPIAQGEIEGEFYYSNLNLSGVYIDGESQICRYARFLPYDQDAQTYDFISAEKLFLADHAIFWIDDLGALRRTDPRDGSTQMIKGDFIESYNWRDDVYTPSDDEICFMNDKCITLYSAGKEPQVLFKRS